MTFNLKGLGLVLVAALAMSAVAAPVAQAEFTFTGWEGTESNHVHTVATGASSNGSFRLTPGAAVIQCSSMTGEGTSATGAEATATAIGQFSGCSAAGSLPITVEVTSCHYTSHITAKRTEHEYTGTVDVACTTPGDAIHIRVFKASPHTAGNLICEYTVEEQFGVGGITYINKTDKAKKYIEVIVQQNNTRTLVSKGGILCGAATGTTHTGSILEGSGIVTGFNTANEQINVTISG